MKKLFCLVVLMMFIGCVNDSTNTVPEQKMGRFAVQKIDTSANVAKRSISEMSGGTINASTDSFFILKNVGTADIEDIKIYSLYAKSGYIPSDSSPDTDFITEAGEINSTNFETAEAAFTVNPGALNVIEPYSEVSTIPLIKISISHGDNANGIGLAPLLPQGENKAYIIITGTSNGVKLQENIEFSTLVNVAKWQVIYDSVSENAIDKVASYEGGKGYILPKDVANIRLQNKGNASFVYGIRSKGNGNVSIIDDVYYTKEITIDSYEIITISQLIKEQCPEYNQYFAYINTKGVMYDTFVFTSDAGHEMAVPISFAISSI